MVEKTPFQFNQPVWAMIDEKKYRGFYQGLTRYGLMHWVSAKPQKKKRNETSANKWSWTGAGWCLEIGQIFARRSNE